LKSYPSSLSRHFWLWGPSGAVGGLLTYAVAGPSAFVLAGIAAGIAPIWLGARYYERRTDSMETVPDAERKDEAVPAAEAWSEQESASVHLPDAAKAVEESAAPETPRLRLLQPYERPLLPFTAPAHLPPTEPNGDEESLEITVDELLVDLAETLSLIRRLKDKHSVRGSTTTPISS
jgi:hypothetical protein